MRKAVLSILFSLTIFTSFALAQQFRWTQLPNSPIPDTTDGRFEDIYFCDANTGFAIVQSGKVYKTTDGGSSWVNSAFTVDNNRSVGFFTPSIGIIGTLDSNNLLYRTTNGGFNWTEISPSIDGVKPKGICGISIVDENTAYGVGRYYCPSN